MLVPDPEGPLYSCDFEDMREDIYSDEHLLYPLDELIPIYDFNKKKCYLICREEFSQIDHHYYIYPNVSQILEAIERKKKSPYYKCTIEPHGEHDCYFVPPEQLTYSEGNGWYCIQCSEYSDLDLEGIEFTDLTYDKVLDKRTNSL